MYAEVGIGPHHSGFSMWQCNHEYEDVWENVYDLLDEIRHNLDNEGVEALYELGVDELPEGVENISGSIYDEPERVFVIAWPPDHNAFPGNVQYFGITAVTDPGWKPVH